MNMSPLTNAVFIADFEKVQYLVDQGAEIDISVIFTAIWRQGVNCRNDIRILKYLVSHTTRITEEVIGKILYEVVGNGSILMLEYFARSIDVGRHGGAALQRAYNYNNKEMASLLVNLGVEDVMAV